MSAKSIPLALAALVTLALAAPARAGCTLGKLAELPVTMSHLRPIVQARLNGADAPFIAGSGAIFSSLSPAAATAYGLSLGPAPFGMTLIGMGGATSNVSVATAKDFTFADVTLHHVQFVVGDKGFGGDAVGLLGQNVLGFADVEYDLADGVIRLMRPHDCGDADLAYWAQAQPVSVIDIETGDAITPHTKAVATVNGVKIRVQFDTGSPRSMLSLAAAARAGIKPDDPGVVPGGYSSGVAQRSYLRTWIAPVASFKLGSEEIQHTRLRIGDMKLYGDTDMLIGADFFLSHRVYVSNRQRKLYFTYGGGSVFNLETAPATETASAPDPASAAGAPADQPGDAEGFARRAAAFASRQDYAAAVADLTRAIALAPGEPKHLFQRGQVEAASHQRPLALADYDAALKLKPDDVLVLAARADLRRAGKEDALARADLEAADRAAAADPDHRLAIAAVYERMQAYPEAIAQLDPWIAAHPHDDRLPTALNNRCWDKALLGQDLDQALADCNAALRLRQGDPTILDSRGLAHLRRGELDKAIADYDAVLKLRPTSAWSLYGRGLARLRKGQTNDGQADLQAATALRPHLPEEAKARGLTP